MCTAGVTVDGSGVQYSMTRSRISLRCTWRVVSDEPPDLADVRHTPGHVLRRRRTSNRRAFINWVEAEVLVGVDFLWCGDLNEVLSESPSSIGPARAESRGQPPFALTNTRNGRLVARTLLTAFDSSSRRKGLLGRDSLADGAAMIIAPSSAVHTFAMRFAIDLMFVSKDGRVLKVKREVKPRRIAAAWRAFAVVELPAGAIERSDTRPGDRLRLDAL